MASQLGAVRRRLPNLLTNPTSITSSSSSSSCARILSQRATTAGTPRFLSSSAPNEDNNTSPSSDTTTTIDPKFLSTIYNQQRSLYKKSVSQLRKQYFAEIQAQRERDAKIAAIQKAKQKRAVLERRRLKAIRSAENAARQITLRDARRAEWEKELKYTQMERDMKKDRYRKARQAIVDDLEEECHLWLTSAEEVEAALGNPTASQILWSRPGGMIGAPSGPDTAFGDDGDFWRYECHTWDARPTYKSPKEVMLEELEYISYLQANNSPEYWTEERVELAEKKEQRARLRSIVREEGRRSLLEKQRLMMRDIYGNSDKNDKGSVSKRLPPTAMPAPKLDYLADYKAQEREGVEILRRDPRRFFVFESDLPTSTNLGGLHDSQDKSQDGDENNSSSSTNSASMGRPVSLRNPFFNNQPTPFPVRMGRDLPEDTRTEKQKKQDERQERMRAAAEEAALAAKTGQAYEVAMAAEEDLDDGSDDVDYDLAEQDAEKDLWEGQMEEWKDVDRRVFDMTPPSSRVTEDEVDWILEQLQSKVKGMQERMEFEEKIRKKEMETSAGSGNRKQIETMDDVDRNVMQDLGYDMEAIEAMVKELTPEQSASLEDIDFTGRAGITAEEMAEEINKVPGLTDEQVQAFVEMEMSLLKDESLKNITKME